MGLFGPNVDKMIAEGNNAGLLQLLSSPNDAKRQKAVDALRSNKWR
jgi:hypothetical protein